MNSTTDTSSDSMTLNVNNSSAGRRATVADPHMCAPAMGGAKDPNRPKKSVQIMSCGEPAGGENFLRSHSISGASGRRRVSFGELPAPASILPSCATAPMGPIIPERVEPGMDDGLDAMGSVISVSVPEDAANDRVLEIGLGMLGQHCIYEASVTIPSDGLPQTDALELVRPIGSGPFNPGLSLEMTKCSRNSPVNGHDLHLRITTGNVSRVSERYFLRPQSDHADQLELIFRATALGKNHGTPSLHVGIHKLGHTADYEESDVQTEWQHVDEEED